MNATHFQDKAFDACSILHVDADAFFASVEQVLNPKLCGKPLIVGGGSRGVVASASYEARKYGIHAAMPIYQAKQQCPHAIFVQGQHEVYGQFSRTMFTIFKRYTPIVERTSIDEGYLDLRGTQDFHRADYFTIAHRVLKQVHQELGITISGGLSSTKMVSKMVASLFKPRQLSWILPGQEKLFLAPLPIESIPGIGPKNKVKLNAAGIYSLGDLAALSLEKAWELLGTYGVILWEKAQGIDRSQVYPHPRQPKSISEEKTFPIDIDSQEILTQEAKKMLKRLCFELRQKSLYAKTLELKIRYSDFKTFTFQETLEKASQLETDFLKSLKQLLAKRNTYFRVRLLGVGLSHFQKEMQLELFGRHKKSIKLQKALDQLRHKYGLKII